MNPVGVQQNVLNPYGVLFLGDSVNPPALPGAINMKALRAFYNALSADFAYTVGAGGGQKGNYPYSSQLYIPMNLMN